MSRLAEAFLDAAYAIALSATSDRFHARAEALARQMEQDGTRIITTRAVLLEIGNALARQRYRVDAVSLLTALEEDPLVEIVPLTEDLFATTFALYCSRQDKEWGLTDCLSFVVMKERSITEALTADDHFRQAGFRVLLHEP